MKVLSKNTSWSLEGDDEVKMVSVTEELLTLKEAMSLGQKHYQNLEAAKKNLRDMEAYIQGKKWVETHEAFEETVQRQEDLVSAFVGATKSYCDKLEAEARTYIATEKAREKYDRLKGERRVAARSAIMARVVGKTGLEQVDHPIMMKLRAEFEKIGRKKNG